MRPSWAEIRNHAADFAREWADAAYEKAETQSFYNDFFEIFGVKRRSVAKYEQRVKKLNNAPGYIDLFWPKVLLVEQKSAGRNLSLARVQADEYFLGLPEHERPRYQLLCDFQNFELADLDEGEETCFTLSELPEHVETFAFMLGIQRRAFRDQDPVNVEASELIAELHDTLRTSGYVGHDLGVLLVQLVFCLFADDTGIFEPRDSFLTFLEDRTLEDGSDLGPKLIQLFELLNTPVTQRQTTTDGDLAEFPYVNGELFAERVQIPAFDSTMRALLLKASTFDWSAISPAIFGALFQSVMDPEARRAQGAHYTTEKNILKVIGPLFLDELSADLKRLSLDRSTRARSGLESFRRRLGTLTFFDPACGCGNFLIIAYRELRLLEIKVLEELKRREPSDQPRLELGSEIDVDQFYGIEIGEFPARIAATAMWMMDHIMNNRLSLALGGMFARIPIAKSPHIHHADALEITWNDVLPAHRCSYVLGNPPYVGKSQQSQLQARQVNELAESIGSNGGTLDYVSAWFICAGHYSRKAQRSAQGSPPQIALVATNSLTQGEQVAHLWPHLFAHCQLEISFAHRTFAWGSDAKGKANVHCVIIGLDTSSNNRGYSKRLFSYSKPTGEPYESQHSMITPYLADGSRLADPHLAVKKEKRPINGMPRLQTGVQALDGGILTFEEEEYQSFLAIEPSARPYFRKYMGGDEYISGSHRWILYLRGAAPSALRKLPKVSERIRQLRVYRASRPRPETVAMAEKPTHLAVDPQLTAPFLAIPNVSSAHREYIPIGWLAPDVVPNQKLRFVQDATLSDFGLLTSSMHMAWMRAVTGRMKSDYSYSIQIVYNTFPLPLKFTDSARTRLEPYAQAVLDARAVHETSTLADLYDTDHMPPNLLAAHRRLDHAVDRAYRKARFSSELERFEYLFGLYERLKRPLDVNEPRSLGRQSASRSRVS